MIKGIIWCNDIENGLEKLNSVIKDYKPFYDISWKVSSKDSSIVVFSNNDIWEVLTTKHNGYGVRCNISYIDHNIDKEYIESVIIPATISLPFNGIQYY